MVSRMAIQWLSLVLLIQLSFFLTCSTIMTFMSWVVWLGELKCAATGLSVLLSFTSERWLLISSCSACSVSPTYCGLQYVGETGQALHERNVLILLFIIPFFGARCSNPRLCQTDRQNCQLQSLSLCMCVRVNNIHESSRL